MNRHTRTHAVLITALLTGMMAIASVASQRADSDAVIVSRGGQDLLMKDVDIMVGDLDPSVRGGYMNSPERIERTLNGLLLARQIAAEAREQGLDQQDEFRRRIQLAEEAVLMKMQIEAHMAALPEPDFEVLARERYQVESKPEWESPEERDVSHILISTDNRTDEAAKELASNVRERIAGGATFEEMARTYSDDNKTKKSSKDLLESQFWRIPALIRGKTEKAFEDAAWTLTETGEISTPVRTSYGYHILRLDGIRPAVKKPFDLVKKNIVTSLKTRWLQDKREQYIASFRAQEMKADPDLVASLRTRYVDSDEQTTGD